MLCAQCSGWHLAAKVARIARCMCGQECRQAGGTLWSGAGECRTADTGLAKVRRPHTAPMLVLKLSRDSWLQLADSILNEKIPIEVKTYDRHFPLAAHILALA